uniref:TATA-box binding protein associated factor 9b n=1 Tax=Ornithorhynchus anatinus TaxID=9258 RepID=A0A6I8PLW2_ORNAN
MEAATAAAKMASPKSAPKDAQVMAQILKDMGITEYEPRVINQMLEFAFRYVTTILEDAKIYSSHAKKSNVDPDDVRLAIQCRTDQSFTSPPPRDFLLDIARQKNQTPLPLIKPYSGPRLPPDRYCLTAPNYRLKPLQKKVSSSAGRITVPRLSVGAVGSRPSTPTLGKGSPGPGRRRGDGRGTPRGRHGPGQSRPPVLPGGGGDRSRPPMSRTGRGSSLLRPAPRDRLSLWFQEPLRPRRYRCRPKWGAPCPWPARGSRCRSPTPRPPTSSQPFPRARRSRTCSSTPPSSHPRTS